MLKWILQYLKGTMDYGLVLGRKNNGVDLLGWTDSDWAQDLNTCHSISGFIFDITGGSVLWSSKKQLMVALSTVEAEYMALVNAMKEAIWLHTLLANLGFHQSTVTVVCADNQGCIVLSCNLVSHSWAKHINIWHHFVCE